MKKEFIKYLKTLDEAALAKELQKLYTKFPVIKKYYEMELSPNTDKIVAECKEQLKKEYFRPNGNLGRGKSSVSRKIITDFKKIAVHQSDLVELWVYRTELMAEYIVQQNYSEDAFINAISNSFKTCCGMIVSEKLETEYEPRCKKIMDLTQDFWGLSEELEYIYEKHFGKF